MNRPSTVNDHLGFALVVLLGTCAVTGLLLYFLPEEDTGALATAASGIHRWSSRLVLAGAAVHGLARAYAQRANRVETYWFGALLFALTFVEHTGGVRLANGIRGALGGVIHNAMLPLGILALSVLHVATARGGLWARDAVRRPQASLLLGVALGTFAVALGLSVADSYEWPLPMTDALSILGSDWPLGFVLAGCLAAPAWAHRWRPAVLTLPWVPALALGFAAVYTVM